MEGYPFWSIGHGRTKCTQESDRAWRVELVRVLELNHKREKLWHEKTIGLELPRLGLECWSVIRSGV